MSRRKQEDPETELLRLMLRAEQPRKRRRISAKMRGRVMARDGHSCFYCGATKDLQVDHVVAVAVGGMDDDSNLVTACGRCNRDKKASSTPAWKARLRERITRGR